nr:unnamed protein product [Callosobruchus analis]
MSFFNFTQYNITFNSYSRLLDLVIENIKCVVSHDQLPLINKLYNFRKADSSKLYMAMIDTDWEHLSHTGVNSTVDEFYDIIYGEG